jgi:hypothetical protein
LFVWRNDGAGRLSLHPPRSQSTSVAAEPGDGLGSGAPVAIARVARRIRLPNGAEPLVLASAILPPGSTPVSGSPRSPPFSRL